MTTQISLCCHLADTLIAFVLPPRDFYLCSSYGKCCRRKIFHYILKLPCDFWVFCMYCFFLLSNFQHFCRRIFTFTLSTQFERDISFLLVCFDVKLDSLGEQGDIELTKISGYQLCLQRRGTD